MSISSCSSSSSSSPSLFSSSSSPSSSFCSSSPSSTSFSSSPSSSSTFSSNSNNSNISSLVATFVRELLLLLASMSWPEWLQPHIDSFVQWVDDLLKYWDLDYLSYLIWLFLPIFIAFLLPIFLLFFIYGCVIFLHCYGLRNRIREAYASSYWDGARTSIASFWDGVGVLWHGYEIKGLENLPDEGPALIVAYHGTLPLDLYYVIAKGILFKKRTIHCVGDKFVFKIPGWGRMCKVFCITPGTIDDCVATLNAGNLLIIAPGGVREALFSNPVNYEIMWGKRLGFAKVVLGADVPVIPMFTENCRDAFRTPRWGRRLFRPLYERTRLPLCPIYGGFPVKMVTHLGKPLRFSPTDSPEEVKNRVRIAVRSLIDENQTLPGSILRSMLHRICKKRKKGGGDTEATAAATTTEDASIEAVENNLRNGGQFEKEEEDKRKEDDARQRRAARMLLSRLKIEEEEGEAKKEEEESCGSNRITPELRPSSRGMVTQPLLFDEGLSNDEELEGRRKRPPVRKRDEEEEEFCDETDVIE